MGAAMTAEHSWPRPPADGYTVDDLLSLQDLPPHTELIDGSLVFVSPQRNFHTDVIDLLVTGLRRTAPPHLKVKREMTVVLDKRNGPEPDVSVVLAESVTGPTQTFYRAEDVVLAVEVVSPDSEARDRNTKPIKYAAAGIPNFWRVEMTGSHNDPLVHAYVLDQQTRSYVHAGMYRDLLKTDEPFDIDIDLTRIADY
ncbi:Uma2 family endonuclease [Streptomyces globosus]